MKRSEEAVIRDQLRRLADRLRNENEALLKLVRQINLAGKEDSRSSEMNKPKK